MYKHYTTYHHNSRINIFEFTPSEDLVSVVCQESVRRPLKSINNDELERLGWEKIAAINLSFFNFSNTSDPIGLNYRGFGIPPTKPTYRNLVGYETYFRDGKLHIADISDKEFVDSVQGKADWGVTLSYTLVLDGEINIRATNDFPHHNTRNPRTCIGQKADGTMVLVVIDGRSQISRGVTAKQSAAIMLQLGCVRAVNADGGGSSQMVYKDKMVNVPSDGPRGRAIANALVVYAKPEVSKRVKEELPLLRRGAQGDYVVKLQQLLLEEGHNLGRFGADGDFGANTLRAVRDFQRANKLVVDGSVGPITWGTLLRGR